AARLRYFGGTTNHWAGFCRPFDDEDFHEREWIPHSGWPFTKRELEPYYKRAHQFCLLGPYNYDPEYWQLRANRELPFDRSRIITKLFQLCPKPRFGQIYRQELRQSQNVTVYLHATVTSLESTPDARTINLARVATLEGNRFSVSARTFVLATG